MHAYTLQIEREREEHLRPRLQLVEVAERASSEVSDRAQVKEESEDEKPVKPKLTPSTLRETRPIDSAPKTFSETNTPVTDDDASRLSAPGHFMEEDSSSQSAFAPSLKEEPMKLGFGSLKLGKQRCALTAFIIEV